MLPRSRPTSRRRVDRVCEAISRNGSPLPKPSSAMVAADGVAKARLIPAQPLYDTGAAEVPPLIRGSPP